jgi:ribose transport system substrate-binding protein
MAGSDWTRLDRRAWHCKALTLVYGVNGNAQAIKNIKNGHMTASAWEDSYKEGFAMVKLLKISKADEAAWTPKVVEVPAVLVTKDTIAAFLREHPEPVGA